MERRRLNPAAALGCIVGLVAIATTARAGDDPHEWLQRMERALATRNYEGVFVHEHGGASETLRILHRVTGSEISERIVSMDGSGREFIRRGSELSTYLPDQKTVLVEKGPDSGLLLTELRAVETTASDQYATREIGHARVAGRDTRVIAVEPFDEFRYGYRIWIDEATAMPLKSQLRAGNGQVVEQLIFTSLTLPVQMADAALQPAVDARGFRWVRYEGARGAATAVDAPAAAWQAGDLPPGFRMTVRSTQRLPGSSATVTHLVFSDGLASVSVFVEAHRREADDAPDPDATRVGSSSAYSTTVDGHRVTAIGEVPPDTVRAIARSLRAAPSGNRAGGDDFGPPIRSSSASRGRPR